MPDRRGVKASQQCVWRPYRSRGPDGAAAAAEAVVPRAGAFASGALQPPTRSGRWISPATRWARAEAFASWRRLIPTHASASLWKWTPACRAEE